MLEGWIYGVCMFWRGAFSCCFRDLIAITGGAAQGALVGDTSHGEGFCRLGDSGCSSVSIRSLGISPIHNLPDFGEGHMYHNARPRPMRDQVGPVWGFLEAAGFQWCGMGGVAYHIWFLCGRAYVNISIPLFVRRALPPVQWNT